MHSLPLCVGTTNDYFVVKVQHADEQFTRSFYYSADEGRSLLRFPRVDDFVNQLAPRMQVCVYTCM